jgi:hypothetical protein
MRTSRPDIRVSASRLQFRCISTNLRRIILDDRREGWGYGVKIVSLTIKNFRGISSLETGELGDTIIVAGQNDSGKSCIFDAIRLLKSVYGGYQQNEWQHFFTEFQIQLHGGSKHLRGLFNDSKFPVLIEARLQLRDREKSFINARADELLEETIWQAVLPEAFQYGGYHKAMFAAQLARTVRSILLRQEFCR